MLGVRPDAEHVEYVHAPVVVGPTTHKEMYVVRDEDGNMQSVVKTGYGDEASLVPTTAESDNDSR
jgi:hypothetical protein